MSGLFTYEINRGLCVQQTTDYEFVKMYCADVVERRHRKFLTEEGAVFGGTGKDSCYSEKGLL